MNRGEALHILEISKRNPNEEEIKTAYRKLARMYHPDVCRDSKLLEEYKQKFFDITEAHKFLANHNLDSSSEFRADVGEIFTDKVDLSKNILDRTEEFLQAGYLSTSLDIIYKLFYNDERFTEIKLEENIKCADLLRLLKQFDGALPLTRKYKELVFAIEMCIIVGVENTYNTPQDLFMVSVSVSGFSKLLLEHKKEVTELCESNKDLRISKNIKGMLTALDNVKKARNNNFFLLYTLFCIALTGVYGVAIFKKNLLLEGSNFVVKVSSVILVFLVLNIIGTVTNIKDKK